MVVCLRMGGEENGESLFNRYSFNLQDENRGAWVAQSVKHLPLAQVMVSGSWD